MYGITRNTCCRLAALLVLMLVPTLLSAQTRKKKDVEVDTVQVPFINGIAVHTDVWGAIQRHTGDHGQYDIGLRLNIKDRYFPVVEAGMGYADQKEAYNEESWFKTSAPFFRVGCDYNILRNKHDIYKLFGGLRYGFSSFDYDASVGIVSGEGEEKTVTYEEHDGLQATYHWMEVIFGTDAKVWGPLHLGWDVRYKKKLQNKHDDIAAPWYIPGFGGDKDAGFSFNFNLIVGF